MTPITRRSFAFSGLAAALAAPAFGRKLTSFGLQLYTVRRIIDKDPARVLKEIEAAGYKEVETALEDLPRIWPALQQTKLKAVGVHLPTDLFLRKQGEMGAALDEAKKHGFEYVICPWIDPKDRGGVEAIKKLAANLNKAGEQATAAGLKLCYHNHAFEFAPAGAQGGMLIDVLLAETDPRYVGWEMDIFWVSVTGHDPVDLMRKYSKRVALMHVKDLAAGVAQRFDEHVPNTAFKEAGAGTLDLKKILHTATEIGVKHFFVEQDETPGDPMASAKMSASYLKSLDF
ncbi:MAG: sugar phosphate isomerase/epimerase [Bryobacteraceae bacterium]|jgi:sugar phosphate isomerase/epimerase